MIQPNSKPFLSIPCAKIQSYNDFFFSPSFSHAVLAAFTLVYTEDDAFSCESTRFACHTVITILMLIVSIAIIIFSPIFSISTCVFNKKVLLYTPPTPQNTMTTMNFDQYISMIEKQSQTVNRF